MINRRAFLCGLTLATLAGPLATEAQQAGKVYRIGFLITGSSTDQRHLIGAFGQGLRELGWVEGQNIVIDYRFADGRFDRLPELAAELVRLKVDIIVAGPTPAAAAAKNATATIPIAMAVVGDPDGLGLIASLARPGGNVTGCRTASAWKLSAKGWSCSRRPSPRSAASRSCRTRPIRPTRWR